ncbi:hypothetical protein EGR_10462 [Echinococcus granulosus]|uniref:Galactosylgalactosylxylosylprotein 3-beta-glucuronosyltransferase n=1 Tax=Echinococcus granulosus TaxID=6210 RepID=W6U0N5_ECHGR|nr:hypothetical protein EGR_10462 [Echinococcus granulosus]EUB54680.1 hypothetical protein EGR_10462 [Echinococcus granulosus]
MRMRMIDKGATWPVGIVATPDQEGRIIKPSNSNKISDFQSKYAPGRNVPNDVAALSVNLMFVCIALYAVEISAGQEGLILTGLGLESA